MPKMGDRARTTSQSAGKPGRSMDYRAWFQTRFQRFLGQWAAILLAILVINLKGDGMKHGVTGIVHTLIASLSCIGVLWGLRTSSTRLVYWSFIAFALVQLVIHYELANKSEKGANIVHVVFDVVVLPLTKVPRMLVTEADAWTFLSIFVGDVFVSARFYLQIVGHSILLSCLRAVLMHSLCVACYLKIRTQMRKAYKLAQGLTNGEATNASQSIPAAISGSMSPLSMSNKGAAHKEADQDKLVQHMEEEQKQVQKQQQQPQEVPHEQRGPALAATVFEAVSSEGVEVAPSFAAQRELKEALSRKACAQQRSAHATKIHNGYNKAKQYVQEARRVVRHLLAILRQRLVKVQQQQAPAHAHGETYQGQQLVQQARQQQQEQEQQQQQQCSKRVSGESSSAAHQEPVDSKQQNKAGECLADGSLGRDTSTPSNPLDNHWKCQAPGLWSPTVQKALFEAVRVQGRSQAPFASKLEDRSAASSSGQDFKDLALQTKLAFGLGTDLLPAVLCGGTAARPKKYATNRVVQVSLKVRSSVIKPSMLPVDAMPGLVGIMKSRHPTLQVRGPAVREGCIIVTLDVMQLAGVLSSVDKQQQQQQQRRQQEQGNANDMHSQGTFHGSDAAAGKDYFRLLQQHVAAAGQQWLSDMGMDNVLEEDTVMSVQVLDTIHHFAWCSESRTWRPCGAELVPFGCQHSIAAHSLAALQTSTCQTQQAKQADPLLLPSCQNSGSSAVAELALDVYTLPREVLRGWQGWEQEEQSGPGVVHVLARLEGFHVPVTILECKQEEPERAGGGEARYARQKQVLRAQVQCLERPCFVQLELWQQHVMLAPACGVLLLPASLAEVAAELQAQDAKSRAKRKGALQSAPSWDCAAMAADYCDSQHEKNLPNKGNSAAGDEASDADDGLAAFVTDFGFWLEEMAHIGSHDCTSSLSQIKFAPSSTLDSMSSASDEHDELCAARNSSPGTEARAHEETINLGIDLLRQAVSWGMPALAEVLLLGLLAEPCCIPFETLANGSPAPPSTQQLDAEEDRMVCLLDLALLSRSRDMLARVLSWGHSLGGPNFAWLWHAQDAHGVQPLLGQACPSKSWDSAADGQSFAYSIAVHAPFLVPNLEGLTPSSPQKQPLQQQQQLQNNHAEMDDAMGEQGHAGYEASECAPGQEAFCEFELTLCAPEGEFDLHGWQGAADAPEELPEAVKSHNLCLLATFGGRYLGTSVKKESLSKVGERVAQVCVSMPDASFGCPRPLMLELWAAGKIVCTYSAMLVPPSFSAGAAALAELQGWAAGLTSTFSEDSGPFTRDLVRWMRFQATAQQQQEQHGMGTARALGLPEGPTQQQLEPMTAVGLDLLAFSLGRGMQGVAGLLLECFASFPFRIPPLSLLDTLSAVRPEGQQGKPPANTSHSKMQLNGTIHSCPTPAAPAPSILISAAPATAPSSVLTRITTAPSAVCCTIAAAARDLAQLFEEEANYRAWSNAQVVPLAKLWTRVWLVGICVGAMRMALTEGVPPILEISSSAPVLLAYTAGTLLIRPGSRHSEVILAAISAVRSCFAFMLGSGILPISETNRLLLGWRSEVPAEIIMMPIMERVRLSWAVPLRVFLAVSLWLLYARLGYPWPATQSIFVNLCSLGVSHVMEQRYRCLYSSQRLSAKQQALADGDADPSRTPMPSGLLGSVEGGKGEGLLRASGLRA